ncbi:hypothetical protein QJS66_08100 [Kocuria rhizophila]|nr:hypothetical protein QJS66_08100 [Kocuria rhizophila]
MSWRRRCGRSTCWRRTGERGRETGHGLGAHPGGRGWRRRRSRSRPHRAGETPQPRRCRSTTARPTRTSCASCRTPGPRSHGVPLLLRGRGARAGVQPERRACPSPDRDVQQTPRRCKRPCGSRIRARAGETDAPFLTPHRSGAGPRATW